MKQKYMMLLLIFVLAAAALPASSSMQELENNYQRALSSNSLQERNQLLNSALEGFLEANEKHPSSDLLVAIGNTFFQMELYPWALVYYGRALRLEPKNNAALMNLTLLKEKMGLSKEEVDFIMGKTNQTLPLSFLIFCVFAIFLSGSLFIWTKKNVFKPLTYTLMIIAIALFSYSFVLYYARDEIAIVVEPTPVYLEHSPNSALAELEPLLRGGIVKVIEVSPDGNWSKVIAMNGTIGFVPYQAVRFIDINN